MKHLTPIRRAELYNCIRLRWWLETPQLAKRFGLAPKTIAGMDLRLRKQAKRA